MLCKLCDNRWLLTLVLLALAGCNLIGPSRDYDAELAHYKELAQSVEHPEVTTPPSFHAGTPEPRTIDHHAAPATPEEWWDVSLEEAIQLAVTRSSVLRDLGGTVIRSPETTPTILEPSLASTDPRFGMEAALSEFDATLATSVIAEKNDRMINNFVASGGTRFFQQDLINFQSQISKVGAAGTRMTLRGISIYDFNNASFNKFPSTWDTLVEAEIRQPLWQGAGTRFNRLAGPNAQPGFYNGVLIARVNTDISTAEFEIALRDLVSNVENAYWDLYFAYRDLDARIAARNAALDAWREIEVAVSKGLANAEREAQAREQYFRYEEEVQNALSGKLQDATTNNNGASGGSFRGTGGVLVSERRLRLAIGLPITDGRMIRPAEEPTLAAVKYDWFGASSDAIARRPELERQRLAIKRREMEFVAARNFLLPRFDLVGRYRVRGLGKNLIGDVVIPPDPADPEGVFGRSSLDNLIGGDFQEWQLGGEVSLPIGYRRGYAAVRNAQLNLAREKAVLEEQERQVIHDLSNAVGDLDRAYQIMQTTFKRRLAAQQHVNILQTARINTGRSITAEQMFEAQRRLSEADIQFHRALVEHMLAIKNVHFEKGTLLEYGRIMFAEQMGASFPPPQTMPVEQAVPAAPAPSAEPNPAMAPTPAQPLVVPPPAPASQLPSPAPPAPAPAAIQPQPTYVTPPPDPMAHPATRPPMTAPPELELMPPSSRRHPLPQRSILQHTPPDPAPTSLAPPPAPQLQPTSQPRFAPPPRAAIQPTTPQATPARYEEQPSQQLIEQTLFARETLTAPPPQATAAVPPPAAQRLPAPPNEPPSVRLPSTLLEWQRLPPGPPPETMRLPANRVTATR